MLNESFVDSENKKDIRIMVSNKNPKIVFIINGNEWRWNNKK